jgi:dGTPase
MSRMGSRRGAFSYGEFLEEAKKAGPEVRSFVEEHLERPLSELKCAGSAAELQQLAFQRFRVFAIGRMTGSVVQVFVDKYKEIMRGEIKGDLVELGTLVPLIKHLKEFAKLRVYTAPEVVKTERAAKQVIRGLLHILAEEGEEKDSKLLRVLVKNVDADGAAGCSASYRHYQTLADYVAGMTDTYAFTLYSRLAGSGSC